MHSRGYLANGHHRRDCRARLQPTTTRTSSGTEAGALHPSTRAAGSCATRDGKADSATELLAFSPPSRVPLGLGIKLIAQAALQQIATPG